jgi:hypothetical protein
MYGLTIQHMAHNQIWWKIYKLMLEGFWTVDPYGRTMTFCQNQHYTVPLAIQVYRRV